MVFVLYYYYKILIQIKFIWFLMVWLIWRFQNKFIKLWIKMEKINNKSIQLYIMEKIKFIILHLYYISNNKILNKINMKFLFHF